MKYLIPIIIVFTNIMCTKAMKISHDQWGQDKLIVPYVIRQPNEIDIPKNDSIFNSWIRRKEIVLEEGFTFALNTEQKGLNFKFYCEINVDNPNVWKLAKKLIERIEGDAYLVYNLHDDEIKYGREILTSEIIRKLESIETEIINNCGINLGVVQDSMTLTEVFIDESKFIKYWGSNEEIFRSVMDEFNLEEKEQMNFIDQFPKIVYDWKFINKNAMSNEELIEYFSKEL